MLRKIQNHLLLHHPLLWNTRIVTLLAVMIPLHILFFIAGYTHGAIDFTETDSRDIFDDTPVVVVFFSVLITVFVFIVWVVFYFRNNAFKAFYPKSNSSLYKEWLILVLACILNCSYCASFLYGTDFRQRNYLSEEEFSRRIDIISMASLFADGSFQHSADIYVTVNNESVQMYRDWFEFRGRKYELNSLINKNITEFSYSAGKRDSLNELRVKRWLVENRKDSVLWLMREFEKIVKSHDLKANVNPERWLSLTYNYPEFNDYITVGRIDHYEEGEVEEYHEYSEITDETVVTTEFVGKNAVIEGDGIDRTSNDVKIVKGRTYIYPKNYVPLKQLTEAYGTISKAWVRPVVDGTFVIIFVCLGIGISLVIFSFRVTSGRSWLIAVVAFGITAVITGILNIVLQEVTRHYDSPFRRNEEAVYLGFWLAIAILLFVYFFTRKSSKGRSDIALNILLWLSPFVLPTIGFMLLEYFEATAVYTNNVRISEANILEIWLKNDPIQFILFCMAAFIAFMYFFSVRIKKWRGLAED